MTHNELTLMSSEEKASFYDIGDAEINSKVRADRVARFVEGNPLAPILWPAGVDGPIDLSEYLVARNAIIAAIEKKLR